MRLLRADTTRAFPKECAAFLGGEEKRAVLRTELIEQKAEPMKEQVQTGYNI